MSSPPPWSSAVEASYEFGRFNEASQEDCDRAASFCAVNAVERARLLPSSDVDRITAEGASAWGLEFHVTDTTFTQRHTFQGRIANQSKLARGTGLVTNVETTEDCKDCCLISNLPFISGLYYRPSERDRGVYFELTIQEANGVIALGTVCRPYPQFRFPGWHRMSAALHLDDMRKFYENPEGGQESGFWEAAGGRPPGPGDTVGCGYEFGTGGTLFFTFNGQRLAPDAFKGLYLDGGHDGYVGIGVDGRNAFTVNFGGDLFRWQPGNEWRWRLDGHIGRLSGPREEDLPSY